MFATPSRADRGVRPALGRTLPLLGVLALSVGACSTMPQPSSPYGGRDPTDVSAAQPVTRVALAQIGAAPRPAAGSGESAAPPSPAAAVAAYAPGPAVLEPLLQLGARFAARHDYPEALDTYRAAQKLAPQDPEIAWHVAKLLLVTDAPQAALDQLQRLLAVRARDPNLYNAMGVAYGLMGKYALAERSFTTGLRIAPDHIGLRDNLGLAQFLRGQYDEAVGTLSQLAALPQAVRARQNLAAIYALHGDLAKAREMADRDLAPATAAANIAYYHALAQEGLPSSAQEAALVFGVQFASDPGNDETTRLAAQADEAEAR